MKKIVFAIIVALLLTGVFLATSANSAPVYEMELQNPETGETFTILLEVPEDMQASADEILLQDLATGEEHSVEVILPTEEEIKADILATAPALYEACTVCKDSSYEGRSVDSIFEELSDIAFHNPKLIKPDGGIVYESEVLYIAEYIANYK